MMMMIIVILIIMTVLVFVVEMQWKIAPVIAMVMVHLFASGCDSGELDPLLMKSKYIHFC